MVNSKVSVTFNPETSQHLVELARATKQSVQKLTEKLVKEAIELEAEDIAFSKIISLSPWLLLYRMYVWNTLTDFSC